VQSLINFELFHDIKIDLSHFYTSEIPLNDANSVVAKPSLVGNISLSYPLKLNTFKTDLKLSVQNIYDTAYSLGYDINAFGNRYYNPAAGRNYMLSLNFNLKKQP
jgi:iron complex outermembrane receptor protein